MKQFSDEKMCRLYEKFIWEFYKRHYPKLNAEASQIDWNVQKYISDMNILPIMKTNVMLLFSLVPS